MVNLMERFFALLLAIVLLPLLLLISFLIKIESKGSIIFKQVRVGIKGEEFNIYKFRTMKVDAPNVATNDLDNPELFITKIGKMLRITSLDELPQLINIIKGEMSFVGPRPVMKEEHKLNQLRLEFGVYNVRPGITGWAQINGRDELTIIEKAYFDKEYVDRKSILFDVKIIILTIYKVLSRSDIRENKILKEKKKLLNKNKGI